MEEKSHGLECGPFGVKEIGELLWGRDEFRTIAKQCAIPCRRTNEVPQCIED